MIDISTIIAFSFVVFILIYSIIMKISNPLDNSYTKLLTGSIFVFLAYAVIIFIKWRAM